MKTVHPDTGSAPDDALATLVNQARAVALATLKAPSNDLVPFQTVLELAQAQPRTKTSPEARASERAVKRVVMHHVGELAFRRRQQSILAAIAAGMTTVLTLVAAVNKLAPNTEYGRNWVVALAVASAAGTVFLGLMAWHSAARERTLRLDIEEAALTLSDRAAYLDTLDEIGLDAFWTR